MIICWFRVLICNHTLHYRKVNLERPKSYAFENETNITQYIKYFAFFDVR